MKIWCEYCQNYHNESEIQKRRLNSAYIDDDKNWMTSCIDAYEEAVSYYEDLWHDYYSGIF